MHKPFEHTLTPADRIIVQKWFVGASLFPEPTGKKIFASCEVGHGRCCYRRSIMRPSRSLTGANNRN
jgi:hypothetical protein